MARWTADFTICHTGAPSNHILHMAETDVTHMGLCSTQYTRQSAAGNMQRGVAFITEFLNDPIISRNTVHVIKKALKY